MTSSDRSPHRPDRRLETGRRAERIAMRHLRRQGWLIIDRNWTTGFGELDLVCRRGRRILFVEVKARVNRGGPGPERAALAVDRRKKNRGTWSPEFDMGRGTVSTFFAFGDLVHARFAAPDAPDALTINSYKSPGPLAPCSLVALERFFDLLGGRHRPREDQRILDREHGTVSEKRQDGMSGIAEQRDAPVRPALERFSIE